MTFLAPSSVNLSTSDLNGTLMYISTAPWRMEEVINGDSLYSSRSRGYRCSLTRRLSA